MIAPFAPFRPSRAALGSLANDPEYAPFGAGALRGLTFSRFGLALLVIVLHSLAYYGFKFDHSFRWGIESFFDMTAISAISAIPMVIVVTLADNLTATSRTSHRVSAFVGAVLVGSLFYTIAFHSVFAFRMRATPWSPFMMIVASLGLAESLAVGGMLAAILFNATRERLALVKLHAARMARVDRERQITEAKLQRLQAQIEPHFLFNTLASVKHLYRVEPRDARQLLENLTRYLRDALPTTRAPEATLGSEIALAQAFLAIFQARMGERLAVEVDVPGALGSLRVPSMMVGTLVENAIKHGIGPRGSGGTVKLSARRAGEQLEICVTDDGVGFRQASGTGIGLSNTRARLATLFGPSGELRLAANPGGGVAASLRIPIPSAEWTGVAA